MFPIIIKKIFQFKSEFLYNKMKIPYVHINSMAQKVFVLFTFVKELN